MKLEQGVLSRAPVGALSDVAGFLANVEHLKSLVLFKVERATRQSRLLIAIDHQIVAFMKLCEDNAKGNPRLAELWRQAQAEVNEDLDKLNRLGISP